jgi:hypothetical protein
MSIKYPVFMQHFTQLHCHSQNGSGSRRTREHLTDDRVAAHGGAAAPPPPNCSWRKK